MNSLAQARSDFQQQASELSAASAFRKTPWLQGFRESAGDLLATLDLPTTKTEDWKYLQLSQVISSNYLSLPTSESCESYAQFSQCLIDDLDAYHLVFVNGVFVPGLSDLDACPHAVLFSEANEAQQQIILEHLDTTKTHVNNYFSTLNSTLVDEGLLIHVPENCKVDKPFYLVNLRAGQQAQTSMLRVLIIAETGSEATLIEQEDAFGEHALMLNGVIECFVNEYARFTHTRLQLDESASAVYSQRVVQHRNSVYELFQLSFAATLKRNDLTVCLLGKNASTDVWACFHGRHQQVIDNHTCVEHIASHCSSQETFRGLAGDQSKAIFNGRIHIHPKAQKTSANLSNKNLLLSNTAEIDTKPELEIYADDVKCAHGATVGQIDSEALFYLQSRGISKVDAKRLLSLAFLNEVVVRLPVSSVQEFMTQRLSTLFDAGK